MMTFGVRQCIRRPAGLVLPALMMLGSGCAAPQALSMRAQRYELEVRLEPEGHRLDARATMELVQEAGTIDRESATSDGTVGTIGGEAAKIKGTSGTIEKEGETIGRKAGTIDERGAAGDGEGVMPLGGARARPIVNERPARVDLWLHPGLDIVGVQASGANVVRHQRISRPEGGGGDGRRSAAGDGDEAAAGLHRIYLDRAAPAMTLFVQYSGVLRQDAAEGEVAGQIHNFEMRTHIGPDGVYLAGGHWYPAPVRARGAAPAVADFVLLADAVEGMTLEAGADRDERLAARAGQSAWRSPYPLPHLVLVGGPHEVHEASHEGRVNLRTQLRAGQRHLADGWLEAARRTLARYEPLIGPYPAGDYTIVDNFFSSGFAFPTFTLLGSMVIEMGERAYNTHGYLDHEMLHAWWGNGVFVDPRSGNWCESLASYGANYYGHVLDGEPEEARRRRRNYAHFLSRLRPEQDRPLGTFGQPGGCGRSIAYDKGAAVMHMLAREMGQENLWAALRAFSLEYLGRHATWEDIRRACEKVAGRSLEQFFAQWVHGSGAPALRLDAALYDAAKKELVLDLFQGEPPFALRVPLRVMHAEGSVDVEVEMKESRESVRVAVAVEPLTVELDPDYHVFRRVAAADIVPTTASTRTGTAFTCVLPEGEVPAAYAQVCARFESSFEEAQRSAVSAAALAEGALAERNVLILGEAVRSAYVSAFLHAIEFPIQWDDEGFSLSGVTYTSPGDAVLCTVRHPGVPGGGVTVLYANDDDAIPHAMSVPMYDHSLVVFEHRRASVRLDFEPRRAIRVQPWAGK